MFGARRDMAEESVNARRYSATNWPRGLAATVTLVCCQPGPPVPSAQLDAVAVDTVASSGHAPAPRRPMLDATFFATSDVHFGFVGLDERNRAAAEAMTKLPSHAFIDERPVAQPGGVLIAGDLTEDGQLEEWNRFLEVYGPTFAYPVYENVGNHDNKRNWQVWDQVSARHGGHWYSVDFGGLHVVSLGEAPTSDGIAYLEADMRKLDPCAAVLIVLHRALMGQWSTDNWFNDGPLPEQMAKALEGHRVVAILHGHHHAAGHYVWKGFDVIKVGAIKEGPPSFVVGHVAGDTATFARWDWEQSQLQSVLTKNIRCDQGK